MGTDPLRLASAEKAGPTKSLKSGGQEVPMKHETMEQGKKPPETDSKIGNNNVEAGATREINEVAATNMLAEMTETEKPAIVVNAEELVVGAAADKAGPDDANNKKGTDDREEGKVCQGGSAEAAVAGEGE